MTTTRLTPTSARVGLLRCTNTQGAATRRETTRPLTGTFYPLLGPWTFNSSVPLGTFLQYIKLLPPEALILPTH